jgi:hypothetical protein
MRRLRVAAVAVALAVAATNEAGAETVNCTAITALPATISTPGIYCLNDDLATAITTGNAVEITANNVIFDLNGHKIAGLAAGTATQATGIFINQRKNVTIRNGTVRGFYGAIRINDTSPYTASQGHLIEDVRADRNTGFGFWVSGRGNILRNNQVVVTGGSTFTGPNVSAIAILVAGPGTRLLKNDVVTVTKQGTALSWGILVSAAADTFLVGNRITQCDRGIEFISSSGKYRDNVTTGVTTPYTGGTDAGNNN